MSKTVAQLWKEVFPLSSCGVIQMNSMVFFTMYLARDNTEVANGIMLNDPLSYRATIEGNDYVETDLGLFVKPEPGSHLAYDRVKLRKKTIKNVTEEKLLKRFRDIQAWLIIHHHRIKDPLFDLDKKLTSSTI